jgi:rhodanese-related sulfurtransferase
MRPSTLTAVTLLAASVAFAQDKTITTQALIAKLAAPADKRDFTLIDARTAVEFSEAHLPGAVAMPAGTVATALPKLVKAKDRTLIFYCNGPNCTKSTKAAKAAASLGYTNVLEYREGLPGWGMAGQKTEGKPLPAFETPAIAAQALKALLATPGAPPVIDVRDAEEYAHFHIEGTVNLPLDEIAQKLDKVAPGNGAIIVDHAGHQTAIAGRLVKSLGRAEVKRLDGGLLKWQEAGLPVVSH